MCAWQSSISDFRRIVLASAFSPHEPLPLPLPPMHALTTARGTCDPWWPLKVSDATDRALTALVWYLLKPAASPATANRSRAWDLADRDLLWVPPSAVVATEKIAPPQVLKVSFSDAASKLDVMRFQTPKKAKHTLI